MATLGLVFDARFSALSFIILLPSSYLPCFLPTIKDHSADHWITITVVINNLRLLERYSQREAKSPPCLLLSMMATDNFSLLSPKPHSHPTQKTKITWLCFSPDNSKNFTIFRWDFSFFPEIRAKAKDNVKKISGSSKSFCEKCDLEEKKLDDSLVEFSDIGNVFDVE